MLTFKLTIEVFRKDATKISAIKTGCSRKYQPLRQAVHLLFRIECWGQGMVTKDLSNDNLFLVQGLQWQYGRLNDSN